MKTEFNIGDTFYIVNLIRNKIEKYTVDKLKFDTHPDLENWEMCILDCIMKEETIYGPFGIIEKREIIDYEMTLNILSIGCENCYDTLEEAEKVLKAAIREEVDEWKKEIKTVKDLLEFPIFHIPEDEKLVAYTERCKELLNVDICVGE